jgi:hypothetical protein
VDLTADTVTVSPTLVASIVPAANKTVRVRGSLASTNSGQDDFILNVHPFHDQNSNSGQVTVDVGSATTYLINGSSFTGDAGLNALAALPSGTIVAAFGTVASATQATLNATSVLAGTSLESASEDRLSGTVVARDQSTLTLRSAIWNKSNGDMNFEMHNTTVMIGAQTTVTEQGQMGSFSVSDISVGQHVDAFGSASQGGNNALTLDATSGQVRLDVTPVWATVSKAQTGSLTLNVQTIDGAPANVFNFSGTGASSATDANPSAYLVNTGTLTQTGVSVNGQIRVLGFVAPFASAPPDFDAETLITAPQVPQFLQVQYNHGGSTTALSGLSASSTSLQLQLPFNNNNNTNNGNCNGNSGGPGNNNCNGNGNGNCNSTSGGSGDNNCSGNGNGGGNGGSGGSIAASDGGGGGGGNDNGDNDGSGFIQTGPQRLSLQNIPSPLTIAPDQNNDNDFFTIGHQGPMQSENFGDFASFVTALADDLNGNTAVHDVTASGHYDSNSNTFTATQIVIVLTQ